eukprot:GEMP01055219.1.p1 GENE.GEMP01055219.1~~GEMP01055219.1.p1  ORF type:complete len:349 (+),score=83.08 GEMP01055219.1:245-1291(+)
MEAHERAKMTSQATDNVLAVKEEDVVAEEENTNAEAAQEDDCAGVPTREDVDAEKRNGEEAKEGSVRSETPKDVEAKKLKRNAEPPKKTATSCRLVECLPTSMKARSAPRPNGRDPHVTWAKTATGEYIPVRSTTCIPGLDNRARDKARVEAELGLSEFGDTLTQFYLRTSDGGPSPLLGIGFQRVVYGDHGPYIELAKHHVNWEAFPIVIEKPEHAFYDEYFTECRTLMLYAQKRPVFSKKNPPPGEWSQANNREEGYANYLSGKHYIEASVEKIYVVNPRMAMQWQDYSAWDEWQVEDAPNSDAVKWQSDAPTYDTLINGPPHLPSFLLYYVSVAVVIRALTNFCL